MIKLDYIRMEIEEGEEYLAAGQAEEAGKRFALAMELLTRNAADAGHIGKFGGPLAGMGLTEILDTLHHGIHHPLLDLVLGGVAGYFVGTKGAKFYGDNLSPLVARSYTGMGDAYKLLGDLVRARECYAGALKLEPQDPIILKRVAEVT